MQMNLQLEMKKDENRLSKEFCHIKPIGSKDPIIKIINDLMRNKKVEEKGLFVIEGLWAYEKILKSSIRIKSFVFCPEFIKNSATLEMVRFFAGAADEVNTISSSLCSKLSTRNEGEGFFLLCSFPEDKLQDVELKENNLIVVLDGLEKPGNIGTIIRSIDAAGGDGVIICNSKVRKTNQKLIKSSMGSSFIVPVVEAEITETINWLKENGFKIIVTDLKASRSYYNTDYKGKVAIVAGNEIRGISEIWNSEKCEKVIIPMYGGADSLNVGVAATLVIYEASFRQRDLIRAT